MRRDQEALEGDETKSGQLRYFPIYDRQKIKNAIWEAWLLIAKAAWDSFQKDVKYFANTDGKVNWGPKLKWDQVPHLLQCFAEKEPRKVTIRNTSGVEGWSIFSFLVICQLRIAHKPATFSRLRGGGRGILQLFYNEEKTKCGIYVCWCIYVCLTMEEKESFKGTQSCCSDGRILKPAFSVTNKQTNKQQKN